jgi:hypothetical protein
MPKASTRAPGEPEVLPPINRSSSGAVTDEHLDYIAALLDDIFRIPGTQIRFGLDAIVGLVPGIGDAVAGIASFLIIFVAWQRGTARVTLARMATNVLLETALGAIPVVGDIFHITRKSNRRNFRLLMRARSEVGKSQAWRDWLFLVLLLVGFLAALILPVVLIAVIVRHYHLW